MEDDKTDVVAGSIRDKFGQLPASSSSCCIYRVPDHIKKGREDCYRPSLISIGPIYHRDPSLHPMEAWKLNFLRLFLEHDSNPHSLEHYIDLIRKQENRIRDCYEQQLSHMPSNEFTEMVLVDAGFVIYFFAMDDPVIPNGGYPFDEDLRPVYCDIRRDLFLEENQLPFFVLEILFQEAFKASVPFPSFCCVACDLISEGMMPLPGKPTAVNETVRNRIQVASDVEHLVDLMRRFCLPSRPRTHSRNTGDLQFPPNATKLKAAGVKFVASKSRNLLDVTFVKGVLEMPTLVLSDFSEALFRSIILFEQRHHYFDSYFIDYLYFLDKLIDTAEDVRVLAQSGIIDNWLSSDKAVADLFNGITDHLTIESSYFYYLSICQDLRAFASIRWNRWKAILKRNYFSHPWAIISVIYAVILLILTVLQTVGSFSSASK